jgi:hypothetical protein
MCLLFGTAQARPVRSGTSADVVDAIQPIEEPRASLVRLGAQSAKGFDGFGLVETRTLFDSR